MFEMFIQRNVVGDGLSSPNQRCGNKVTFFSRLILLVNNLKGLVFVALQDFSCVSPFISSTVISFAVIVKGNGLQVHGHDDDESLGHLPNDFTLNGKRKIL